MGCNSSKDSLEDVKVEARAAAGAELQAIHEKKLGERIAELEKLHLEKFEDIRSRLNFWSEKPRFKDSFARSWTICLETTSEYKRVPWKRCKKLSKRIWLAFLRIRIFVQFMRSASPSCQEIWNSRGDCAEKNDEIDLFIVSILYIKVVRFMTHDFHWRSRMWCSNQFSYKLALQMI